MYGGMKKPRYRSDVQKLNEEILELDEVLYGMEKEVEVRFRCFVSHTLPLHALTYPHPVMSSYHPYLRPVTAGAAGGVGGDGDEVQAAGDGHAETEPGAHGEAQGGATRRGVLVVGCGWARSHDGFAVYADRL